MVYSYESLSHARTLADFNIKREVSPTDSEVNFKKSQIYEQPAYPGAIQAKEAIQASDLFHEVNYLKRLEMSYR